MQLALTIAPQVDSDALAYVIKLGLREVQRPAQVQVRSGARTQVFDVSVR